MLYDIIEARMVMDMDRGILFFILYSCFISTLSNETSELVDDNAALYLLSYVSFFGMMRGAGIEYPFTLVSDI